MFQNKKGYKIHLLNTDDRRRGKDRGESTALGNGSNEGERVNTQEERKTKKQKL